MNALELRLGNIIKDTRHPERECTVFRLTCGVDFNITYHYSKSNELSYSKENINALQPVPITEEWLRKLGFVAEGINYHTFSKNGSTVLLQTDGRVFYLTTCSDVEFKYVHQLQNLYYAITGNELTIKD